MAKVEIPNTKVMYYVDSIHHFRGKIHYSAFPLHDNQEDYNYSSIPVSTLSINYLKSRAVSSLFSLLENAWVAVTSVSSSIGIGPVKEYAADSADDIDKRNRVFFVNGWNAWSFCGSILQGQSLPLYNLPCMFVKNFHSGGPALKFNLERRNGSREWIASGNFLLIYICNFYVLNHFLLIYICKLHWNFLKICSPCLPTALQDMALL